MKSQVTICAFLALTLLNGKGVSANGEMAFPGDAWAEVTPESQHVDSNKLNQAVAYLKEHSGRHGVTELVVIRNGRMIWKGSNIDNVHGIWSCTKSFTSTVLGLLIEDGKCSLDTTAKTVLPDMTPYYPAVTLRHFTTMTSGYRAKGDETTGSYVHGPSSTPFIPDPHPLFTPGTEFAYWDSAMNQFGNALAQIAGQSMMSVFKGRIADPIGMNPNQWQWGSFGKVNNIEVNGGSGNNGRHVKISAREMARLGHLFLNRGNWNGRPLIGADWVDTATALHVPDTMELGGPVNHGNKNSIFPIDGAGVYGFNWWVNGLKSNGKRKWQGIPVETYSASGHNNNDMFVIPPWNMVVVRLGMDQRDHEITDDEYASFLRQIGEAID